MPRICALIVVLVLVHGGRASAGQAADRAFDPVGFWTGAIIKETAVLPVTLTITKTEDGYRSFSRFPDWLYYIPLEPDIVRPTADGFIVEGLLEGDAVLTAARGFDQLYGTVGETSSGRRLHLKRMPPPPVSALSVEAVTFAAPDGTHLSGTVLMPPGEAVLGGMVMVRGRGCATRLEARARLFAEYGIAVLSYDKRGAGASEGDCTTFTHEDLTKDAAAAFEHLAQHPRTDPARIGFFGESAGAWTVQAATERLRANDTGPSPAFLVTWIGPATSILQQQISSAATYGAAIGLTAAQQQVLVDATMIIADDTLADDDAYAALSVIKDRAAKEGWLDRGFGPDDLPRARDEMAGLWLRRFRYDPAPFLMSLDDLPYLAVFGAKDTIVPVEENVAALSRARDGDGDGDRADVTIVVRPESGHGDNLGERRVDLASGESVWMFEAVDGGFTTATIDFLRAGGFATR